MNKRSSFSGKLGFVLAAAGSAVGLGNIWRFPYLAAQYGGGTFLLIYLIIAVTFGFSLMVAEIASEERQACRPSVRSRLWTPASGSWESWRPPYPLSFFHIIPSSEDGSSNILPSS